MDGGRSGSRALVIDALGRVLGRGLGGDANHQGQGYDSAIANVAAGVESACRDAEVSLNDIALAHFALAGDDVPHDHDSLQRGLQARLRGLRFTHGNDVWAGLRAGSTDGVGIAVNCGSGCGTVGRSPQGETAIIPDLGYMFGDSGGGHQIAVDAIRAVFRAWDGRGAPTALCAPLLAIAGQPDVPSLYQHLAREKLPRVKTDAITRLVFEAAAAGDAVASSILRYIGDELGVAAVAVTRRLNMTACAFTFVLTGGAFRSLNTVLARSAIERLHTVAPRAEPTLPLLLPVAGATLLALDGDGVQVTSDHYATLRASGYAGATNHSSLTTHHSKRGMS